MLEAAIETYLRELVESLGGLCIKLNPLWYVGIPDRLVLLPGGVVIFVETKRPKGGRLGPKQPWWRDKLRALGFRVETPCTKEQVDAIFL